MIAKRLQFDAQKYGIAHTNQYGGTIQHSTSDAGIHLIHNIKSMWNENIDPTAVLLNVAQFFPSINQKLLGKIMRKQGFNSQLCTFFKDYLTNKYTQFVFNGQTLPEQRFDTGVG